MKKELSVTIGIPTYYGGEGLVETVKSILGSKGVPKFRLIVNIDANPLTPEVESQLKKLGAEVIFSAIRGGQVARIKQMISLTKSDLLVLTQDDIKFEPDTLEKILKAFKENPKVTMLSARLLPASSKTFLESVIEVGVRLTHRIGDSWKGGDNYLLSTGRCLAFKTDFVKKFAIPEEVINSDAYLYFENKRKGGRFLALKDAVIYNKSPQTLKEQLKQSRKFQYSFEELTNHLKIDTSEEYKIPKPVVVRAYIQEFIHHPVETLIYLALFLYTRTFGQNMYSKAKGFWDTDVSTKRKE